MTGLIWHGACLPWAEAERNQGLHAGVVLLPMPERKLWFSVVRNQRAFRKRVHADKWLGPQSRALSPLPLWKECKGIIKGFKSEKGKVQEWRRGIKDSRKIGLQRSLSRWADVKSPSFLFVSGGGMKKITWLLCVEYFKTFFNILHILLFRTAGMDSPNRQD